MKPRLPTWWLIPAVILAGAIASWWISLLLVEPWINLGWRRPVQDLMTAHGLGRFAGHFGLFHFYVPDIVLNLLGGALIGVLGYRKRLRYAAIYAGSYFAAPYLWTILDGSFSFPTSINPPRVHVLIILNNLALIPIAVGAAWLTARPKRRRDARLAAHCCTSCGYDLTGNVSGICPECGRRIT